MKESRKGAGKARAKAATAQSEAAAWLRLPPRAGPVRRRLSTAPYRGQVAAAARDCATCFSACNLLPAPLRPTCIQLCRDVCRL
jgi:hypothetical protein